MSENVIIPARRAVEVRAYTNAWYQQTAKLSFYALGSGTPFQTWDLSGTGEGNTAMTGSGFVNGIRWVPERADSYTIKVEAWYRKDGGTHPHATMPANATLGLFNISTVLCEDDVDKDWNDTVVQFTWWNPPRT
ncbi:MULTISPECIES: hypothetical protein [Streptomyces]|uniref:hypothetical protein n=1 Tax=Streptomyces TaxID=1883 RepID=UPI001679BE16|nr:hypothetical protein [Streptomyces noursei]MCZ1020330.1 hypothetical protein [Streptomyces noursei]GGX55162.1 hypothetical protein GCM10010341_90120 [Streptomyces noursei]